MNKKFKIKNYRKNRRIHTISKTRLKFSNSKIAYKNILNKKRKNLITLNKFFVFFLSKKYVKIQKLKKKLNLDHF